MNTKLAITMSVWMLYFLGAYTQTNNPPLGKLFDDTHLSRVDISLPPDSMEQIMDPTNASSNYEYHATFIYTHKNGIDTLENVGFRLRGNTSRNADKKSFKVSFNTYQAGRKYDGVEKLNLNGEHNDPSISRAKICWDLFRWAGIPAPRANHVKFYVNNIYMGLYINVEHIDEEFVQKRFGSDRGNLYKCLYPATLEYTGSSQSSYKQEVFGRRPYDLKTNKSEDDYSGLVSFIDVLNNTPINDLPCELEKVFNVDSYLKVIALDILTANWDGPIFNKNNFYLYDNPVTGLFEYIPYDLDNTFGIDWFNEDWSTRNIYNWSNANEARPIYDRILQVQAYKKRFSYYMDQFVQGFYQPSTLFPYIDSLELMIESAAESDTFRTLDYGFTITDFHEAFDMAWGNHVPIGIKPFITARRNASISQLDVKNIEPILRNLSVSPPQLNQAVDIQVKIEDEAISMVELSYQLNNGSPTSISMADDGMVGDSVSGDGVFFARIPAFSTSGNLSFHIVATDMQNKTSRSPVCESYTIAYGKEKPVLRINEFMAKNDSAFADNFGEYDDWIELYNAGSQAVELGELYLSDDFSRPDRWQLPDTLLPSNAYLILWADDDGHQGNTHANFKLKQGGEQIGIFDAATFGFRPIDTISYGSQSANLSSGRLPNGSGNFQTLPTPSPGASNNPTSIETLYQQAGVNIHLATIHSPINIDLHVESQLSGKLRIELLDIQGRHISQQSYPLNPGEHTYHIRGFSLSAGTYLVRIQAQTSTSLLPFLSKKIIIKS